eukprot:GCRY01000916.1.p1 GENE.GCRY01000916.1~~GCRY01000916.1.p1  ORF type:complete len:374 (-),score=85.90 GCRY01000916.1:19-1140(-)
MQSLLRSASSLLKGRVGSRLLSTGLDVPKTMVALSKTRPEKGIWMEEVPVPEIGDDDILVKIKKTAICGTDIHIYNWDEWAQKTIPYPMVVGHEYAGIVHRVGANVKNVNIGDRVSGEGHIVCGTCKHCRTGVEHLCMNTRGIGVNRPGCFAQYLKAPARNAYKLPDFIPDEVASIFDPFGNAVHTALSFDLVGKDVLITGAGPIGVMAVGVCKKAGARSVTITDINNLRLDQAKMFGATFAVNTLDTPLSAIRRDADLPYGWDVGLEMSGNMQAFNSMVANMTHGGNVALLGIPSGTDPVDWNAIVFHGLKLKGIYGREMFNTWYQMESLLAAGLDVSPIITHRLPINDFSEGFEVMASGRSGKVVLDWEAL